MKNLMRPKAARTTRRLWLAAWAVAVTAAVAGAAGIAAGQGNAAPAIKAGKASYPPRTAKFKRPKLKQGVLTINGTKASDKIALRLQAGQPDILQVDVGDDGSPDFSFERAKVAKIAVKARSGDDLVRIDESNGVFTDTIPTTIAGGDGNDPIARGTGVETLLGGAGNDTIDGNGGTDLARAAAVDDTCVGHPVAGADTARAQL